MSQTWLEDFQFQGGKLSECIYLASSPDFQWNELGVQKPEWMHSGARKEKDAKSQQNLSIPKRYKETWIRWWKS